MKRTNKRQQSSMSDDEPTTTSQANSVYAVPKESILNGHFAGAIPDELLNLTDIEKTMISIYSPVTKYSLCTKEHFRINGATTYTIVNDLFTIANQLPKKIDPSTIGILQTRSRKLNSNFTFRPLIVKNALTWLKQNNHLYNSVDLHWYEENFDWDSASEVYIPVIELTDEDELQIDNELLSNTSITNSEQLTINNGSYSQDSEILLMTSDCINSELQDIKQLTENSKEFVTVEKSYPYTFAHPYRDSKYFLAKCFPYFTGKVGNKK